MDLAAGGTLRIDVDGGQVVWPILGRDDAWDVQEFLPLRISECITGGGKPRSLGAATRHVPSL